MMLSVALAGMIDKTECLMFLETPNSVVASNTIKQTESPWIYNELFLSSVIQVDEKLTRRKTKTFAGMEREFKNLNENFIVRYDLSFDHLVKISNDDIKLWKIEYESKIKDDVHPLDVLYKQKLIAIK